MQHVSLAQKQQLRAIPLQIQANAILGMGLIELQQFVENEAAENPALCVKDGCRCPVCAFLTANRVCPVCGASLKNATDSSALYSERDYLHRAFTSAGSCSVFDPFRTVAATFDLKDYLKQQSGMRLGGRGLRIAEYIVEVLDEDGYFREPMYDTAEAFAASVPEVEEILQVIQGLDPPGIGARDLRECLLIQIANLPDADPAALLATRMLTDAWEEFTKMKLKAVAVKLDTCLEEIAEASEFIRERLNPHPASMFRTPYDDMQPATTSSLVADVAIVNRGDELTIQVSDSYGSVLCTDETYDNAYEQFMSGMTTLSEEDVRHVREHVERVKIILEAVELRKKTLARVARFLVDYQHDYLLQGPAYLRPILQKEVAVELGLHESTISRAISDKYCRLPSGEIISFDVFFDSAMPIRDMVARIIAGAETPMSDGEIATLLQERGVTIARRTVAKYRDQLRLLPNHLRRS